MVELPRSRRELVLITVSLVIEMVMVLPRTRRILIIFENLDIDLPLLDATSIVEVDGMIYALGGNDGSASLNSMERFDLIFELIKKFR